MAKTTLSLGIFICLLNIVSAQVPQLDSLRLWFPIDWDDSNRLVKLRPAALLLSKEDKFFRYQIRVTDATLRPGNVVEKTDGVFFISPRDTTELLTKNIHFDPEKDFNVFLYILEGEFVVEAAVWNFDENFAARRRQPAKPKPIQAYLAPDNFEIDALIFNETRTPFGKEFYRLFAQRWQPPDKISGYWITIREIQTPGRFTLIAVSLNNRELFQRLLNPRREFMESLASQTVEYLLSLLQNGNFDGGLSNEDLFGREIGDRDSEKF